MRPRAGQRKPSMRRIRQAVHKEAFDPMPGIGQKNTPSQGCLHPFHSKLQNYWLTTSAASGFGGGSGCPASSAAAALLDRLGAERPVGRDWFPSRRLAFEGALRTRIERSNSAGRAVASRFGMRPRHGGRIKSGLGAAASGTDFWTGNWTSKIGRPPRPLTPGSSYYPAGNRHAAPMPLRNPFS